MRKEREEKEEGGREEGRREREGGREKGEGGRRTDGRTGRAQCEAVPLLHRCLSCLPFPIMTDRKHTAACTLLCAPQTHHNYVAHAHSTFGTHVTHAHLTLHYNEAAHISVRCTSVQLYLQAAK